MRAALPPFLLAAGLALVCAAGDARRVAGAVPTTPAAAPHAASYVVHGGTIHVGDGAGTTVEALAVRAGRVVHAGTRAQARAALGEGAGELDLAGATCVPGLQDAHGHVLGRVEHAQVVAEDDWGRFRGLGVVPSMQPRHATSVDPVSCAPPELLTARVLATIIEGEHVYEAR